MSENSVITSLCNGQVVAKNTDDLPTAIRHYVQILRSGVLLTDVRPLLDSHIAVEDTPLHVTKVSFLHANLHVGSTTTDFADCSH